ncbi:MAG: type I DNA topoisomerase [Nitrospinota bacterium]
MPRSLLIVESPAKVRTLRKFLGGDFSVKASVGHIRDLPKEELGVDVADRFRPDYQVIPGKEKVVKDLRAAARGAKRIYLAPDPDREGEAIAWHIQEEIAPHARGDIYRVNFNAITARAVREALERPGQVDSRKVDAQQTRRVLDRLVGYKLSPLLWEKVRGGLSAGRVQSVALRLLCEREKEIEAFVPREYWSLTATLEGKAPPSFQAKLFRVDGQEADLPDEASARAIQEELEKATYRVEKVEKKRRKRRPYPPFTTSTLQQEGAKRLRFSAQRTMRLAQQLYEGVDLGGEEGPVGLITYMRTDSARIAPEAQEAARALIRESFGADFLPPMPPAYKSKKGAQEAHEAIRPTLLDHPPERLAGRLTKDQLSLYQLVWNRFLASQMAPALYDQTTVEVGAGRCALKATGSVLLFPGFTRVYEEAREAPEEGEGQEGALPPLEEGEELRLHGLEPRQHFTQPPSRYTDASLVKALEENGIGRPSTYAAILSTLTERGYAERRKRQFHPTELGRTVNELLVGSFPEMVDVAFTAQMEAQLDAIEEGERGRVETLEGFYSSFARALERAKEKCELCGRPMEIRWGRYGRFLSCSGYPKCKGRRALPSPEKEVPEEQKALEERAAPCEKCGSPMVVRKGRRGAFLACSAYPKCKNTRPLPGGEEDERPAASDQPAEEVCDACGRPMVVRRGRRGPFLACTGYPDCRNTRPLPTRVASRPLPTGVACPREGCGGQLAERRTKRGKIFFGCANYPACDFASWDRPYPRACPRCGHPHLVVKWTKGEGRHLACPEKTCDHREDFPEVEAVGADRG